MLNRKPLKRTPLKRKSHKKRAGDDPAYKGFIAGLPCLLCTQYEMRQTTRTEVAHVGDRGYGQKCPDRETLPLCTWHHQVGNTAHHVIGKRFWTIHNLDRDALVEHYNAKYDRGEV